MNIGIDIDGVLTNIESWQIDCGSKYNYLKYNKEIINYKAYNTIDIFNSTKEKDKLFWQEYFKDYSKNIEPRKYAAEVIKKLHNDGHKIFIITARGTFLSHSSEIMSYQENQKIVKNWLKKNKIYYDSLIFSKEDKLKICLDNKIDIMIEDSPRNITQLSQCIPIICYHANYNQDINGKNITRCYSWYDIYSKISKQDI